MIRTVRREKTVFNGFLKVKVMLHRASSIEECCHLAKEIIFAVFKSEREGLEDPGCNTH